MAPVQVSDVWHLTGQPRTGAGTTSRGGRQSQSLCTRPPRIEGGDVRRYNYCGYQSNPARKTKTNKRKAVCIMFGDNLRTKHRHSFNDEQQQANSLSFKLHSPQHL